MTVWWIAQFALIGALLSVAALGAEAALKVARRQTRWVWLAAMGLTVTLGALAPMRRAADLAAPPIVRVNTLYYEGVPAVRLEGGMLYWARTQLTELKSAFIGASHRGWNAWQSIMPDGTDRALILVWAAASVLLLIAFAMVHLRFQRRRAQWPRAELLGTPVRVADDTGPAVIGVTSAEIVVPQWLLQRDANEQRLVLEHELEHVRQHDPLLLALAQVAVILLPWNPALWWMASRLRLAIELDCDRRVLQRGASARDYGSLLIDLTDHRAGFGAALPAFSCTPSHLERRLIAMTPKKLRYPLVRALGTTALASLALLAACEAKLPTEDEMNNMTAATATQAVGRVAMMDTMDVSYFVNGTQLTKAEANAIKPDSIASVSVLKKSTGGEIWIVTRDASAAGAPDQAGSAKTPAGATPLARATMIFKADSSRTSALVRSDTLRPVMTGDAPAFNGLLVVDGVVRDANTINSISPDRIESVNIVKGAAATALYSDPRAANGVIQITTKKTKP
jgi:TonB-dependent SusC/RagA subfamily outer membrane receptor